MCLASRRLEVAGLHGHAHGQRHVPICVEGFERITIRRFDLGDMRTKVAQARRRHGAGHIQRDADNAHIDQGGEHVLRNL